MFNSIKFNLHFIFSIAFVYKLVLYTYFSYKLIFVIDEDENNLLITANKALKSPDLIYSYNTEVNKYQSDTKRKEAQAKYNDGLHIENEIRMRSDELT